MRSAIKTIPGASFYERLKQVSNMLIRQPQSMRQFIMAIAFALTCTAASAQNAYIPNQGDGTVSVIDTTNDTVIATVVVGRYPIGVGVSPDGSKVYIGNASDNTVSVINTADNTVIATVGLTGENSRGVSVSPDSSKMYVANSDSYSVSVINAANNTVIATVEVGSGPRGVAVSPNS